MAPRIFQIQLSYRTGRNDLVEVSFVPYLDYIKVYRRSTGLLDSNGLTLAAMGVLVKDQEIVQN